MKKLYIFTLILTLSVSACDTFDKTLLLNGLRKELLQRWKICNMQ